MNDLWIIAAIAALVLWAGRKSSAATNAGRPVVGDGGTIWTADSQFFYDGEFWYKLGSNGYYLIDGQANG